MSVLLDILIWYLIGISPLLGFILAMGIYRAYLAKRLPKWLLILFAPLIVFLLMFDVLGNLIVGTVVFLDLPREWLLTDRLKRYREDKSTVGIYWWRSSLSAFICDNLLDVFDVKGDHC